MKAKIGFIGAGTMGWALMQGLEGSGFGLVAFDLKGVEMENVAQASGYGEVAACDVVFLCVKPGDLGDAAAGIRKASFGLGVHPLVVSVAAGKTLAFLENSLPGERIVRAMPNLAAGIGKSFTCFCANPLATEGDIRLVEEIFNCVGSCARVREESLDAVTAIAGCGPAYFFYLAKELCDGGVAMGLDPEISESLAKSVLIGASGLADTSGEAFDALLAKISVPGSATQAAIQSFESDNAGEAIRRGLNAAKDKCSKLGKE